MHDSIQLKKEIALEVAGIGSDLIFATEVDVLIKPKISVLPEVENQNQFMSLLKRLSKTQMTSEERIEHNAARRK
jgi:hypothetical protein